MRPAFLNYAYGYRDRNWLMLKKLHVRQTAVTYSGSISLAPLTLANEYYFEETLTKFQLLHRNESNNQRFQFPI